MGLSHAMSREYVAWDSPALGRRMEMLFFGHSGRPMIWLSRRQRWTSWRLRIRRAYLLDCGVIETYNLPGLARGSQ